MPKYSFECKVCTLTFERRLKQAVHLQHACPNCGRDSGRILDQFAFDFAEGKHPGNSGVSKLDNPTADNIVGRDAAKRHDYVAKRAEVKRQVREAGGTLALTRRNGVAPDGTPFVEYAAAPKAVETRKELTKDLKNVLGAPSTTVKVEEIGKKP